jgi:hypothetical protein
VRATSGQSPNTPDQLTKKSLEAVTEFLTYRDSTKPEMYTLQTHRYERQEPDRTGWVLSPVTGSELRSGKPGKLALRLAGDEK